MLMRAEVITTVMTLVLGGCRCGRECRGAQDCPEPLGCFEGTCIECDKSGCAPGLTCCNQGGGVSCVKSDLCECPLDACDAAPADGASLTDAATPSLDASASDAASGADGGPVADADAGNPGPTCPGVGAFCGDFFCFGPPETCTTCPIDCGTCSPTCGNGTCEAGETCLNCAIDCGSCCGNGVCDWSSTNEDCYNCPADCGTCACGDGLCASSMGFEGCWNCPIDCGKCTNVCGNGICESPEDCFCCSSDCGIC
jgi:hypothetical protein